MGNIRVVTDSASDLPESLAVKEAVAVVRLDVRLDGTSDEMLTNAPPERFWQLAAQSSGLAETAAPSPGVFKETFLTAAANGNDGVCCVTISSALSATYQSACTAANEVRDTIPVEVVDSRFATMGQGLIVLEAAAAASAGGDLSLVANAATESIARTFTYGTLDTLEYLRRGGRIGSAQAFLGSLLSIKPVIEVKDGVVEGESRQRTRLRSFHYLADKVVGAGPLKRIAVVHAAAGDVDAFVEMIKDVPSTEELVVTFIGPVIGAHTGPGTIGVCGLRA